MDEMYEVLRTTAELSEKALMSPDNLMAMMPSSDYHSLLFSAADHHQNRSHHHQNHHLPMFGSDDVELASAVSEAGSFTPEFHGGGSGNAGGVGAEVEEGGGHVCGVIKARIASHPTFPRLLQAYIDCQKVGAPPEIASFLDEICRDSDLCKRDGVSSCLGADPELDQFMELYCDMLVKYKSDLERPFEEANTFLSKIELQLSNLCTDEVEASSDEELSRGEVQVQEEAQRSENRDLKDILLRKFGSHIGTLKLEFSKKKKKGKLPREARQTLLDWWNVHNKWPYPTEADKIALAESTGLDQRQINNWFINQRKRHWKPSESMQFSGMDSISGQFFTDD